MPTPASRLSRRISRRRRRARRVLRGRGNRARRCRAPSRSQSTPTICRAARALGGRVAHAARSARIGQQHARRRDRRRRDRRRQPLARHRRRRRGRRGRFASARACCAPKSIARRERTGCGFPSIRRAARSAPSAEWRRRTPPARTRCISARCAVGCARIDCVFADGSRAEIRRGGTGAARHRSRSRRFLAAAPTLGERERAGSRRRMPA